MPRISLFSISRFLWALTLVCLPITSFRYMPFMGSGTMVRPLSIYPLALLLVVIAIRLWRKEIQRPWPASLTVLSLFVLAALASTAIGATFAPIELRGSDYTDRALRALLTLPIGISFFLAAAWMNQRPEDMRFTVRWLLVGLAAHLVWGIIQFFGLNFGFRRALVQFQELFSVRGLVKNKRISGFAFEPSWLAAQLSMLYLPWLMGLVIEKAGIRLPQGSFWEKMKYWLEPILLVVSLAILVMTYSRSGLFVVVVAGLVTLLFSGGPLFGVIRTWWVDDFRSAPWLRFGLAGLLAAVVLGGGFLLADKGYIASFWESDASDLWDYLVDVSLGPRMAYAVAATQAFDINPFTGVGLGASGFHIYGNLPDDVLINVPEISRALSPASTQFPNPKNLYMRLLVETGMLGTVLFVLFWLNLFADALELRSRPGREPRALAAMAIFTLVAVALQAASQDSFAMPELWLNLGVLAGISGFYRKTASKEIA